MSESEAKALIEWFKTRKGKTLKLNDRGVDCVVEALEEIQQYRAIGTVSEFRELKEKATAKKPNGVFFSREDGCRVGNCLSCGRYIKHREHKHCPRCGSLVDWSEGKE